jgi:hypothetical protein
MLRWILANGWTGLVEVLVFLKASRRDPEKWRLTFLNSAAQHIDYNCATPSLRVWTSNY